MGKKLNANQGGGGGFWKSLLTKFRDILPQQQRVWGKEALGKRAETLKEGDNERQLLASGLAQMKLGKGTVRSVTWGGGALRRKKKIYKGGRSFTAFAAWGMTLGTGEKGTDNEKFCAEDLLKKLAPTMR